MGKYYKGSDLDKGRLENDKFVFKVNVNVHGKRHTEHYSIDRNELFSAKGLGLLNDRNEFVDYLDWKPLTGASDISGGVKRVNSFTSDDKYIYANTDEKVYSLPKYLEKKLVRRDFILFGKRER